MRPPEIVELRELPVHNRTYHQHDAFQSFELQARFDAFVEGLWAFDNEGIDLFTGMLGSKVDSATLQKILGLMRRTIVGLTKSEHSVGYVPPPEAPDNATIEPIFLHSDLYISKVLFLIFDLVPKDGTGATTLLRFDKFVDVLKTSCLVPSEVIDRIRYLYEADDDMDHFDELYSILHGPHPWTGSLRTKLDSCLTRLTMRRGEGYRIHDRNWLHGRDAASSGHLSKRFHRLVFPLQRPLDRAGASRHF